LALAIKQSSTASQTIIMNLPLARAWISFMVFSGALCRVVGAETSASNEPAISKTPENRQTADAILRSSFAALSSLPFPEENSRHIANLLAKTAATPFAKLPCVNAYIAAVGNENSYILAHCDSSSRTSYDRSKETKKSVVVSGSASFVPGRISGDVKGEWSKSTTFRDAGSQEYSFQTKPGFNHEEFNQLRETANRDYVSMVQELNRMGFGLVLDDLLCKHKWVWRFHTGATGGTITFNFKNDGTWVGKFKPDSMMDWIKLGGGIVDTGYGDWTLNGPTLDVTMMHVSIVGVKKSWRVPWIHEEIVYASESKILLGTEDDNRMTSAP
jgi:hypothetical protein